MKILLVSNYLNDAQESMQRFASSMEEGLVKAGHEVRVIRPESVFGRLLPSGEGVGKWLGYADKFGLFPRRLKAAVRWPDVVHICDHSNAFYSKYLKSKPHVVSCHDLLAVRSALGEIPGNQTRWTGHQLQRLIAKGLYGAQHISCVSEATRKELLRVLKISERRTSRIYNSLNYPFSRMNTDEAKDRVCKMGIEPGETFFLHVGGNQWYKNRLGTLHIFSSIRKRCLEQNFKLVMVGKPWTNEMRQFVVDNGLSEVTFERVDVGNEDLRALYSSAAMLLFPSLAEGFGWPIIEAQACGCPVLTSSRPPMNEVGGTAAVYVDPLDVEGAAAAAIDGLKRTNSLNEAGLRNASQFGSGVMIAGYVSAYEKVCREKSVQINPISKLVPDAL
jgi:glycosyltransferase involved in cell wall biosynthesis